MEIVKNPKHMRPHVRDDGGYDGDELGGVGGLRMGPLR